MFAAESSEVVAEVGIQENSSAAVAGIVDQNSYSGREGLGELEQVGPDCESVPVAGLAVPIVTGGAGDPTEAGSGLEEDSEDIGESEQLQDPAVIKMTRQSLGAGLSEEAVEGVWVEE